MTQHAAAHLSAWICRATEENTRAKLDSHSDVALDAKRLEGCEHTHRGEPYDYVAPRPEHGTLSNPTSGFPNTRATRAEASAANPASSLGGEIASRVQFVATCKHGILAQARG